MKFWMHQNYHCGFPFLSSVLPHSVPDHWNFSQSWYLSAFKKHDYFWRKGLWDFQCSFWNQKDALTFIVQWLSKQNSGWWILKQLHSTQCNSTALAQGWDSFLYTDRLTNAGNAEGHGKLFIYTTRYRWSLARLLPSSIYQRPSRSFSPTNNHAH